MSAMRVRMLGPFRGGRSTAVTGVVSEPNLFYMGTTGGGVWRTDDAGHTWQNISDKFFGGSIGAVAVAPSDEAAAKAVQSQAKKKDGGKDAVIWHLDAGTVLRALGRYEDSNVHFAKAAERIEEYEAGAEVRLGGSRYQNHGDQPLLYLPGEAYDCAFADPHGLRIVGQLLGRRVFVDVGVNQYQLTIRQDQRIHRGIGVGTGTLAQDLIDIVQMQIGAAEGAANHAVGITFMNRHRANQRMTTAHFQASPLLGNALAVRHR
jgi:hypothetical protein